MSENLISDRVILPNRQDSVNLEEAIMMYVSIIKRSKRETRAVIRYLCFSQTICLVED
jgi:hypothetical protein